VIVEIVFVTNDAFPVAALPDAALTLRYPNRIATMIT
jgi:hypothetical protein